MGLERLPLAFHRLLLTSSSLSLLPHPLLSSSPSLCPLHHLLPPTPHPSEVCLNSRIRQTHQPDVAEDKAEAPKKETKAKKYALKPGHRLESHFLKSQAEKAERKQQEAKAKAERAASAPKPRADIRPEEDDLYGLRVHAWILVLPTRRGVPEPFFIGRPPH